MFYTYLSAFLNAITANAYTPTAVQHYFVNPATPFNNTPSGLALYALPKISFAISFAWLLTNLLARRDRLH
ncbi:hypothetical protein K432DRAFT_383073 [Lepidopterella palustris CBS 459.81]|uniref:Uncharacterized protein n=1 Tax=Lepidopterella palustris CBS 459.81 TaxID=1314670 RepID=A0A8E2E8J3_9PEZI|nr:hypothetical protein K432DRAFT_383073 [Lepidopterella palustris CBS 459.81]